MVTNHFVNWIPPAHPVNGLKTVQAPVQLKLEELERNLLPDIKEKFEKRLSEGFDLDTDSLYNNWKQ